MAAPAPPPPVEDLFREGSTTPVCTSSSSGTALLRVSGWRGGDGLLQLHVVPDDPRNDAQLARAGIPRPSFYLLRPDGYVGLCGPRLDPARVSSYASGHLDVRLSCGSPAPACLHG